MNILNGTNRHMRFAYLNDLSVTVALKSLVGQPLVVPFLTCEIFKGVNNNMSEKYVKVINNFLPEKIYDKYNEYSKKLLTLYLDK